MPLSSGGLYGLVRLLRSGGGLPDVKQFLAEALPFAPIKKVRQLLSKAESVLQGITQISKTTLPKRGLLKDIPLIRDIRINDPINDRIRYDLAVKYILRDKSGRKIYDQIVTAVLNESSPLSFNEITAKGKEMAKEAITESPELLEKALGLVADEPEVAITYVGRAY